MHSCFVLENIHVVRREGLAFLISVLFLATLTATSLSTITGDGSCSGADA